MEDNIENNINIEDEKNKEEKKYENNTNHINNNPKNEINQKEENKVKENEINPNIIINNDKNEVNIKLNINNENKNNNNNKTSEEKFLELQSETFKMIEETTKKRETQGFLRGLVSQDKNRFCYDGFDLDLTYITPKIIAMGKPSTLIEGIYRNNLDDVLQFFNQRHFQHYKVYNLCEEDFYPPNTFFKQASFPFQDHEAPPLNLIHPFCVDAKKFLDLDPENVVAIH